MLHPRWSHLIPLGLFTLFGPLLAGAGTPAPLQLGAPAPAFDLPGVDGRNYTLDDFKDARVLAVIFTCNHCPTAQAYEERLIQITTDYRDKGVAVVAISPNDPLAVRLDELGYSDLNDDLDDMILRAEDAGFNFPYLYDGETQEASRKYGPVATPHVFVFDQDRKLRYAGRIDDAENPERVQQHDLRNALDALLAGQPVPVEQTKTMGCSTKWSDKRHTVAEALARWEQEEVTLEQTGAEQLRALVKNDSDKLRLINVWATWCVPCLDEMPELVDINRMYRGRDFELITVCADPPERQAKALEFLRKFHASTKNYIFESDQTYEMAEAIDPEWPGGLPYTLLVKPGGEVVYRMLGRFDALELKRAIVDVLGRTYH